MNRNRWVFVLVWVLIMGIGGYLTLGRAKATEIRVTSFSDLMKGKFFGTEANSSLGSIKLNDNSSWTGRAWTTPNMTLSDQAAIGTDEKNLYLLANGTVEMNRYLVEENRWEILKTAPRTTYSGAGMAWMDGYFYVIFGGYQREFYRYSPDLNTWEELAMIPDLVASGAQIVSDGTLIYVIRGGGASDFWVYDPITNSWNSLNTPPATISAGSGSVYDEGSIYTLRGGTTNTFYKYSISLGVWTSLATAPATFSEDHHISTDGDYIYVTRDAQTQSFYRYSISGNSWTTLINTPIVTRYVGSIYIPSDDKVYVFRGNATYDFWKYDQDNNVFLGVPDLPNTPGTGSDLLIYNNTIYYLRGNSSQNFYQFSLGATGVGATWVTLQNTPATMADDIKATVSGNYIYAFRGGGTNTMYRYDLTQGIGGTWAVGATTPATVNYGGAMIYPGSGSFVYGTRGGFSRSFWRMTVNGTGETWSDTAVADLPNDAESGYGSRLATDGTDIYMITGSTISRLYKYSISGDSWTALTNLPFSPFYGTDMTYYGGKLYFQAGYYKTDVWEYTIATNSFRRIADLGTAYGTLLGPYSGGSLEVDSNGNMYSTSGQNLNWIQKYTVSGNNYQASGSYESEVLDLIRVAAYDSINVASTIPSGGEVIVNTRSSSDQMSWSGWTAAVGNSITSPTARFLQVGLTLVAGTGQSTTPVVTEIAVNYTQSNAVPSPPNTFEGLSKEVGGVTLSSGGTYVYTNPYFSWSGASDSDGIKGYYVYFGTDSAADPVSEGNYQISNNYQVNLPLSTGVYYLRIKSVDEADSNSATVSAFIYAYNGISPPNEINVEVNADFETGTTLATTINDNKLRLKSKAGFFPEERLTYVPFVAYNGADMAYVESSGKMYVELGNGSNRFYEYNVVLDVWTSLATAPAGFGAGGAIVAGPTGYIYALRGNNTKNFWRYDINTGTWNDAAAAETPQEAYYGASMVYDGERFIYALKGNGDDTFMRYDTETDNWTTLINVDFGQPLYQVNNMVSYGGNLTIDKNNGLIYATQGNTRSGFAVYDIENQSWTRLPDLPALAYYGGRIEFDPEDNEVFYIPGWDKDYFYKYNVVNQTWTELGRGPLTFGYGTAMRLVGDNLIVLRGVNSNLVYKYNIEKDNWYIPNVGLFGTWYRGTNSRSFGSGAEIAKGEGNNYYIARGNWDSSLVRYNSVSGEVTKLTDAPFGFYNGCEIAYDSGRNKLYVSGSTYYNRLFVYDIASDTWSEGLGTSMPTDSGQGTALAYDGSTYLYRLRGDGTTTFDRYNVVTGVWSTLPAAPGALGYGADMVIKNDFAYVVRGSGTTSFYRYGPLSAGSTWSSTAVANLPAAQTIGQDGFLVDIGGNNLMACRGQNLNTCFMYSIGSNLWSTMPSVPANIYQGGAAASNGAEEMYFIAGAGGTNTYNMALYRYVIGSTISSYEETGNWISPVYDLGSLYRYAGLEVGYSGADNTTIQVYTRVSGNGSTWSDWVEADTYKETGTLRNYVIESETERYFQIKTVLNSGNGIYSGTLDSLKLSYYTDANLPTNPTTSFYSYIGGSESISTNWGNSTAPYFDWPSVGESGGASDVGSGVLGYYVYFGTGETADPAVLGTYTTGTSFVGTGLTLGQTYYFRLKTVDDAGNLSSDVGNTFVYKFDNEAPNNPVVVLVDPQGYTTETEFDFTWGSGSDNYAGVAWYCYKTGATEGVWASEQCVSSVGTTGVSGVPKYKSDENIFYIRTKDAAGNYALSYQTAVYKYSGSAPSAPQNLHLTYPASGNSNTENDFGFAWDIPESYLGNVNNIIYYYSINEVPTPSNVTRLSTGVRYLPRDQYATRRDVNTLYVVAADEAGNIKEENGKYTNYASIDFVAATSAPGVPTNLDISDVSIKETESWRLALSWTEPEATGSGISVYKVYRSGTSGASCSEDEDDFSYIASTSQTSYVDTGLTQSEKSYCIKSCDSTNECSAPSSTVVLYPDGRWRVAPSLESSPSATVKTKSAIVEWVTSRAASSFVKYGKSSGEYGEEVGSSDQLINHEITLTGLDPGTTYYYKALWTDEDGNTGESDEYSLSTNAAPKVSTVKMTDIGMYSAYVTFTLENASSAKIMYGKTSNYGSEIDLITSTSSSDYTVKLDDLEEGATYHIKIVAEDEEDNVFSSDDYEFETLPVPKISQVQIQQVRGASTATVRISWISNTSISSIVNYYQVGKMEMARNQIVLTATKKHELFIKDLSNDSDYVFKVDGKDAMGNSAEAISIPFKTSTDLRAPMVSNLKTESSVTGVGEEAKAQITVSWDTDENSSAQVEYGNGTGSDYPNKTQEQDRMGKNHVAILTDLKPGTVYHLRVVVKDAAGNEAKSYDNVVITPNATKAALNLVIEGLSKSFGFFGSLSGVVQQ